MYFAVDPCNPALVVEAVEAVIAQRPDLNWFALVDSAFDADAKKKLAFPVKYCLYDSDALFELLDVSPYLVDLPVSDEPALRSLLTTLARHRHNRPMLSFVGSPHPASHVADHWKRLVDIKGSDNTEFILRFADTRILATLPACPDESLWQALCAPVAEWLYIDRAGSVAQLAVVQGDEASTITVMSDRQFAFLVEAGEADHAISIIERDHVELLPASSHAAFHDRIAEVCRFAHRNAVSAFPDIVGLCIYALVTGVLLERDLRLNALLKAKNWTSGKLIDELVNLVDEQE